MQTCENTMLVARQPYFIIFTYFVTLLKNETATWPHVYQMGPHHWEGASNVVGASQEVSQLPNLHNLQSIT